MSASFEDRALDRISDLERENADLESTITRLTTERDAFANTIRLLTEENLTVTIPRLEAAEAEVTRLKEELGAVLWNARIEGAPWGNMGSSGPQCRACIFCHGVHPDDARMGGWREGTEGHKATCFYLTLTTTEKGEADGE